MSSRDYKQGQGNMTTFWTVVASSITVTVGSSVLANKNPHLHYDSKIDGVSVSFYETRIPHQNHLILREKSPVHFVDTNNDFLVDKVRKDSQWYDRATPADFLEPGFDSVQSTFDTYIGEIKKRKAADLMRGVQ